MPRNSRTPPVARRSLRDHAFGWALNVCYMALIVAALPWLLWTAWRKGKYREGFAQKLLGWVPRRWGEHPCVWMHAVSVGEVNLLGTLIAELTRQQPDLAIVISTTTKTGHDLARARYAEHTVFYCPLDFTWSVRAAMYRVRPTILVLAELELWPNLLSAACSYGAKTAIINGRLSEKSYRGYQRIRRQIAPLLQQLDLIATQTDETTSRFLDIGADANRVVCTGSLKFDGVQTERNNAATEKLAALAKLTPQDQVFLAGSTQAPEESYALETFQSLLEQHPDLKLVLVPRHPDRFAEVAKLLDHSQLPWIRRTQLGHKTRNKRQPSWQVLLVDCVGELGAWWGTASVGFVGGSFGPREGQNMLEPAGFGVALCFGPRTKNFRDIVQRLLAANAAQVVKQPQQLTQFVSQMLKDKPAAQAQGQRAQQLVESQLGATQRTVELLLPLLGADDVSTAKQQSHAA